MKSSSSKSLQTMFDPVLPDAMLPRDCLLEQGWSPVPLNPFKLSLILFTWCFAPYGLFTGTRMESSSSESLQTMFDPVLPDAMLPSDCLLEQGWSPVPRNPFKLCLILFYLMLCSLGIVCWSKDGVQFFRIPSKLSLILFYLMLYSLGIVYWNKDGVQFLGIPSNYQD